MKGHTQLYMKAFGYGVSDFIACEICGAKAVDIHHIDARGMGGSRIKDHIENLMAVCRGCHMEHGDKKDRKNTLRVMHFHVMKNHGLNVPHETSEEANRLAIEEVLHGEGEFFNKINL